MSNSTGILRTVIKNRENSDSQFYPNMYITFPCGDQKINSIEVWNSHDLPSSQQYEPMNVTGLSSANLLRGYPQYPGWMVVRRLQVPIKGFDDCSLIPKWVKFTSGL